MYKDIYVSLDYAREELKRRRNDENLKQMIEKELGGNFMENFKDKPRAVLFRQLCTAENASELYYYRAKYLGAEPLVLEYFDDIFVHFNECKKALGRLRVELADGSPAMLDIMDFHKNEKCKIGEIKTKNGEGLVEFHHNLLDMLGHDFELLDNSKWFHNIGAAREYYYYLMLHFVAHGVLFERFILDPEEDEGESQFASQVVLPAIERIEEKFGLSPLILRLSPEKQSGEEDFFWYSYPPIINDFLLDYAEKNGLNLKKTKI